MGALDGIRVLGLGVLVRAPQAALLLGDMGASVNKPGTLDDWGVGVRRDEKVGWGSTESGQHA